MGLLGVQLLKRVGFVEIKKKESRLKVFLQSQWIDAVSVGEEAALRRRELAPALDSTGGDSARYRRNPMTAAILLTISPDVSGQTD